MTQRWPVVVAAAYAHVVPLAYYARDAWAIERMEPTPVTFTCPVFPPIRESPDPCGLHRHIARDLVQPERAACPAHEPIPTDPPFVPSPRLHRVSGLVDIQPPDRVRSAMVAEGKARLAGSYKLCLDKLGHVSGVTRLHSTGDDTYDQRLAAALWNWRYQPFVLDGRPREVCTTVSFVFSLR